MSYKVKLDIFEGPFDLLVYLIEREGVDIYEVNISEITDQYIGYVSAIEEVDPETAAEFMVLAATLLQIKSRMLLPLPGGTDVGEEQEDPRQELAERLQEYRRFREAARQLRLREEEASRIFSKPAEDLSEYLDNPVESLNVSIDAFIRSFRQFLEKRRRIEDVKKRYQRVARERMTMEAKSEFVISRLQKSGKAMFSELVSDFGDIYDVVLTFVTLLEMMAQGALTVHQEHQFGDIEITIKDR